MKLNNNFKPPPPTKSELKLRNILRTKKIPFKESQVIWYTGCDNYTPDLIIGRNLIIEVDGKIHDQEFRKTPDRIRERALRNMGYDVFRVKNEQIQKTPNVVAERIIQKYFEAADAEDDDDKTIKITKIERPSDYDPVPREIVDNIEVWAALLNKELNSDDSQRWTAEYFKEALGRFPNINPEIVSIRDKSTLEAHIDNFNENFSKIGITVEPSEIKVECKSALRKLPDKDEISKYGWLSEWINE
jgi:very-short-patch-repair endonuclease